MRYLLMKHHGRDKIRYFSLRLLLPAFALMLLLLPEFGEAKIAHMPRSNTLAVDSMSNHGAIEDELEGSADHKDDENKFEGSADDKEYEDKTDGLANQEVIEHRLVGDDKKFEGSGDDKDYNLEGSANHEDIEDKFEGLANHQDDKVEGSADHEVDEDTFEGSADLKDDEDKTRVSF